MEILVTGIAGGLARRVARKLLARGERVVGVDYRAYELPLGPESIASIRTYVANYNKTAIEDIFRKHRFKAVLHLGRVGNLKEDVGKRFDLNVMGSQKLMNLCVQHAIESVVVLSTFHVYGAHPRNHIPISEEDPLHAGTDFPQLADAIQLDNMASTWVWRYPQVRTVVLRPTNVVGPTIKNTMSSFMRRPIVPHLLGFDPMMQFIHEQDLADAVLAAMDGPRQEVPPPSSTSDPKTLAPRGENGRGVFNIAGPTVLPWSAALELLGARTFPLPSIVAAAWAKAQGLPGYLINFYKYPCVISDEAFRKAYEWAPRRTMRETLGDAIRDPRRGK